MVPYFKSRVLPGDFQPIIAYLFTEWKCNLDCHYCWSYDNRVKGMTEDTARRAIDWLETTPCRVLAPTGGEPLLRPDFVHKVIYYAAKKDFWVYLATNARLLRPEVIDRLADAGIATINFAVDAIKEKPGLPKALEHVRSYFDYLVKRQYRYGYTVFFNVNICRTNIDDVKELVEIAHDNGISLTFHINEAPMMEQSHFKHLHENDTYIRPQDFPMVEDVLDYLIDKQRQGYKMVDSIPRLQNMKGFMRGVGEHWGCRGGQKRDACDEVAVEAGRARVPGRDGKFRVAGSSNAKGKPSPGEMADSAAPPGLLILRTLDPTANPSTPLRASPVRCIVSRLRRFAATQDRHRC
jgi:MoaA/NifB/PqqE/SkfB family radical SAM enzyme